MKFEKELNMRKKSLYFLPILALALMLSACGAKTAAIEDYTWQMRTVMTNDMDAASDTDTDAFVPVVGQPDELYPNAKVVEMTLIAKDGVITLTDITNEKTYSGTYKVTEKSSSGIIYEVTIDRKSGHATVSPTEEYGGTAVPTLPINLGDYSLYFVPADTQTK